MHELADTVVAGRYVLERELGHGGMATVWLARDTLHDRRVAIKIIRHELAVAIGIERFIREIQLTARLQHPNIAQLLDSGVMRSPDGTSLPWYAMPYLDGESLRARLAREQQISIEEALRITEAVASALQAAHRQGIVHRDIKPENVLFADAGVYVVDFGIAKALLDTGSERLTSSGVNIGTPSYMSPEQISAGSIDARSDQYSLATVLYEMLTGEPPFTGNAQAIMSRRFVEPARPLRSVRSTISESVEHAVLRALERVPADRFPDVASFAEALRRPALSDGFSSRRPKLRKGWLAAGMATLLVLVTLSLWLRFGTALGVGRAASDPEVRALYQRGLRGYDRRTAAGITDAVTAFSAAIKRDSAYAPAWNGLAKTYVRAYERPFSIPGVSRDSMLALAVSAVQRSLASDSLSTDTWVTQSLLSRDVDPTDNKPVTRSLRRAVALDSTSAPAWHWLAMTLAESQDFTGALTAWRRSVTVDPSYTQGLAFLALGHYWRRQYDSASVWADSAIAVDPNYLLGHTAAGYIAVERGDYNRSVSEFEAARRLSRDVEVPNSLAGLALAEARAGRRREALATLRQAESDAKAYALFPHTGVYMAQAYAALGDADRAVAWLERYQTRRSMHFQLHLRCDPPLDSIASNQNFRSLLVVPRPLPSRGC